VRIVCISDTHTLHSQIPSAIPDGDVLIHAGDLTNMGDLKDVVDFNDWLQSLPHPYKIVIAGNHDFCFEQDAKNAEARLTHCTYLLDSSVKIEGLVFYGSPWQPRFFDWAFNLDRGAPLAAKWAEIPENTDVLITHGPPHCVFDRTSRGENTGCEDLLQRVRELKPRLHVFGHIHEAYGMREIDGIIFVNASICTLAYEPVNAPVVVDL